MREMSSSSWLRRGSSIVFDRQTLGPLIGGGALVSLREAEGVVVGFEPTGFVRVFFRSLGERQVPLQALQEAESWNDLVIAGLRQVTPEAVERLWLAIEAADLPLTESAATLTSAKVELLPHQVVIVHRVANARPRRFLIADEVGLGKTRDGAHPAGAGVARRDASGANGRSCWLGGQLAARAQRGF